MALLTGLLGGAVAVGLLALAERTRKRARVDDDGWKRLRPGWLLHLVFGGSAALAGIAAFTLAIGGSSRPDKESQDLATLALAILFGIAALFVGWLSYGRSIRWKGQALATRMPFSTETVRTFDEIKRVAVSPMLGTARILFCDGRSLHISLYMHGIEELLSRLP